MTIMPLINAAKLVIYFCLFFSSTSLLASSISYKVETSQSTDKQLDSQLIQTLENNTIFQKLDQFVEQNLKLEKHITFIFRHQSTDYFSPNSYSPSSLSINSNSETLGMDGNEQQLIIPFAFLYQLYHSISVKFPQQHNIRDRIYASAVEKHLWFELGRILINQYSLSVSGSEDYLLDNFSTIMLINLSDVDSDYILDATEAYLLADHSQPLMRNEKFQNELEIDEHRYRIVVCLILGKDLSIKSNQALNDTEPFVDLLSELSWGKKRLAECRQLYRQKLLAWYQALSPYLKEKNQLKMWLKAEHIS